ERLNAPVLKTGDGRPSVGSNPTSSAIHTESMQPCCVDFLFACDLSLLIDLNTLVFFNILLIFPSAGSITTRKSPINLGDLSYCAHPSPLSYSPNHNDNTQCSGLIIPDTILGGTVATMT
ncbi:hypothetical protein, partial [Aeromonas veronii]|uniref:hypothetical protein n=1 Tax=Aeromonas veronii TaxID=654 RepID=UPI003D1FD991